MAFCAAARQTEWNTSNFFKRKGDLLDSTAGPLGLEQLFGEEEYSLDGERPRKRPRFSTSFRMVERTPSPGPHPEGDEDDGFEEGPSLDEIEASRLASMPDGPLEIFRDGPSPTQSAGRPSHINMPPPPAPQGELATEMYDEPYGETPDSPSLVPAPSQQLPLVSPFPHHGLSGNDDYMTVETDGQWHKTAAKDEEWNKAAEAAAEGDQHIGRKVLVSETDPFLTHTSNMSEDQSSNITIDPVSTVASGRAGQFFGGGGQVINRFVGGGYRVDSYVGGLIFAHV